ncbi:CmcJ/NvfI family oxidoreductase [Rugamonas sp. CCM 8940]|uniref:CmcJ/NvfI family oxidoreductase n=1 Tax=Rugamonas sp. CCM 8940 TaxID=2765359 RepID=UPI0018F5B9F6|nr:CmcJ/NvfI family oxidoreductase [Rugamonas sp. CCM 8940]MBJ7309002.1 methyltransferase [Rugamonas sp. CCM 8940]
MRQVPTGPDTVTAALEFLCPANERPYTYMYPPPDGGPWQNSDYRRENVRVRDARAVAASLSIDREGFELHHAPSAVRDFMNQDEVLRYHYPEAAQLACAATGASRAIVFDHLLRRRQPGPPLAFGRRDGHRPGAAGRVHCDFTLASAQRRLAIEMGDADAASKIARYSIVNLWRPIRHPVLDVPLALCDARTVAPGQLVASDIFYPERGGEIYQAVYGAEFAWSYFSALTRDETLIFKQFDSLRTGVARFTPHAAFEHPAAPDDAPPRESIETRCLLIFD